MVVWSKVLDEKETRIDDFEEIINMFKRKISNRMAKKIIRYAGGDYYTADLLLPRLYSLCQGKCTLVEVFGGSGFISQEADRNVFSNVIYNDIDNRLAELYKAVKENPREFMELLLLLPYSRFLYNLIDDLIRKGAKELASIELAVFAFYVANAKVHGGLGIGGFYHGKVPDSNPAREFRNHTLAIYELASKWADITIENLDFRDVIKKYDSEKTVFYLDPPYPDKSQSIYDLSFTVNDLRDLARILRQIKGKFLLKLDGKTYSMIQDLLPDGTYNVERFNMSKNMEIIVDGKKRENWILVLVSNKVTKPNLMTQYF